MRPPNLVYLKASRRAAQHVPEIKKMVFLLQQGNEEQMVKILGRNQKGNYCSVQQVQKQLPFCFHRLKLLWSLCQLIVVKSGHQFLFLSYVQFESLLVKLLQKQLIIVIQSNTTHTLTKWTKECTWIWFWTYHDKPYTCILSSSCNNLQNQLETGQWCFHNPKSMIYWLIWEGLATTFPSQYGISLQHIMKTCPRVC